MTASPANFVNRVFFGYQNTATLKAALELDVFTLIGKNAIDAAALAAKCKASPRGVAALCNSLVVMGFLTKSAAGYAQTEDAAVFLDPEFARLHCKHSRVLGLPRIGRHDVPGPRRRGAPWRRARPG